MLFILFMDLSYYIVGRYIHLIGSNLTLSLEQTLIMDSATLQIQYTQDGFQI